LCVIVGALVDRTTLNDVSELVGNAGSGAGELKCYQEVIGAGRLASLKVGEAAIDHDGNVKLGEVNAKAVHVMLEAVGDCILVQEVLQIGRGGDVLGLVAVKDAGRSLEQEVALGQPALNDLAGRIPARRLLPVTLEVVGRVDGAAVGVDSDE
jgi:hypothetical protein